MRNYKAEDVDDYIARSDPEAWPVMKEIRRVIKSTVPGAEESISWGIPFYKYHGLLAGFSVFKNHVGFGFADRLSEDLREELERQGYTSGAKTVQIKFEQKIPVKIIKQILTAKVLGNEANRRQPMELP